MSDEAKDYGEPWSDVQGPAGNVWPITRNGFTGPPNLKRAISCVNALAGLPDPAAAIGEMVAASDNLGFWMSAALSDDLVCEEMKSAINNWFAALARFTPQREGGA